MHNDLICHPETSSTAISAITVTVTRAAGGVLLLDYDVSGTPQLLVPSPERVLHGRRSDDLWLHTCFEAFIKPVGGEAYIECNLAPTRDWQVYALSGYRRDRRPADMVAKPVVTSEVSDGRYHLRVMWVLGDVATAAAWQIGIAAVTEDVEGKISYWALRHAPDKPDFHHADAFALTVEP